MPNSNYDLSEAYFQVIKMNSDSQAEEAFNSWKEEYMAGPGAEAAKEQSKAREAFVNEERDVYNQQKKAQTESLSKAREAFVQAERESYQPQPEKRTGLIGKTADYVEKFPLVKETRSFIENTHEEGTNAVVGGVIDFTEDIGELHRQVGKLIWGLTDKITGGKTKSAFGDTATQEFRDYINADKVDFVKKEVKEEFESKTLPGQMGRYFIRHGLKYIPIIKIFKALGLGILAADTAAGAISTAMEDPYEDRLSNFIQEYPSLRNPVTDFLEADPDDPEWVARAKNGIEDAIVNIMFEGAAKGVKAGGRAVFKPLLDKATNFFQQIKVKRALKATEAGKKIANTFDENLKSNQVSMGCEEKVEAIAKSLEQADTEEAAEAAFKSMDEVLRDNSKAIEEATQAALKEADQLTPEDTVKILSAQKKARIIPEDFMSRSPEEIADIKQYAVSRGREGVTELLDTISSKQNSIIEAVNTGDVDAAARQLNDLRRLLSDSNTPITQTNVDLEFFSEGINKAFKEGNPDQITKQISGIRKLLSDESGQVFLEGLRGINPIYAGVGGGGASGFFVDYNGNGNVDENGNPIVDWQDIALGMLYGFTAGVAVKYAGDVITHNKEKATAFKAFKEEKLAQFAQYETKIKERLAKGTLSEATRQELKNNLEFLAQVKNHMDKVKSYDDYVKKIKNPKAKARLEKKLEPVIKVNDSNLDNFMNNLQTGDLGKSLEINFNSIDSEEGIKALNEAVYESFGKEISKARNGIQSWDATKELATDLGISSATVNDAFKGVQDLHGKALAARITLMASRNKLSTMIKEAIQNSDDSAKTILAIRKQVALHAGLQAEVSGMKTEMGRALNSLKILSNTTEEFGSKEMNVLLEELGGRENNIEAMKKFLKLNPTQQNIFIKNFGEHPIKATLNQINSIYIKALLWRPTTWAANLIGNTLTTGVAIVDNVASETLSNTVRIFRPDFVGTAPGSTAAMVYGIKESFLDACSAFGKAIKTGESLFGETKVEIEAILPRYTGDNEIGKFLQGGLDMLGTAWNTGGRVVVGSDDFAKVINKRMALRKEAYQYAYERALSERLQGEALFKRAYEYADEIVSAPARELEERALQFAKEQTFSNTLDADRHVVAATGKSIQYLANKVPPLRLVFPFIKTPTNIGVYISERTPILNMLGEKFYRIWKQGTQEEKSLLTAQMGVTILVGTAIWNFAEKGIITGSGPKDKSAKQLGGWQPNSFKVGDKYYSYNRFDPVAGMLGMVADAHDLTSEIGDEETKFKVIWAWGMAAYKNLMSKAYMQNIAEFIDALSSQDPDRFETLASRILAGFTPGIVEGVERSVDPTYNETFNFFDSLKAKIPGWSDTLPPKRNIFGEEVGLNMSGNPDLNWLNPVNYSEESKDPVKIELSKLKHFSPGAILYRMKSIDGVELTPEQYDQYILLMGQPLKEYLNELVQSEEWKQASDGDEDFPGTKQAMVKRAISHFKIQAKAKLLEANPDLQEKILSRKQQKVDALLGEE